MEEQLPTGNPDTWGEPLPAPKKWGKPSKETTENPDVFQPPPVVPRIKDDRTFEEILREAQHKREELVREKLESGTTPAPPREKYDPWGWDILGTPDYLWGSFTNWLKFGESFEESFKYKTRPIEVVDRIKYEQYRKIEVGEIPLRPNEYIFYKGRRVTTQEEYKEYGREKRLEWESPAGVEARSSWWHNLVGDTVYNPITWIFPVKYLSYGKEGFKSLLFTGRRGKELETALQAFKMRSITKIRKISAAYIDPTTEKLARTVSKLKYETAAKKAQKVRKAELQELRNTALINLVHEKNLVFQDMASLRKTMHAEIGENAEELITIYINYPESRRGLEGAVPKIKEYAALYNKMNAVIAKEEVGWKALDAVMDESKYLHKTLTPEAEKILKAGKTPLALDDITNSAGIQRAWGDIMSQNRAFKAKTGKDLFDMDAVNAQFARMVLNRESAAAVNYLNLIDSIYGIPIKDMPNSGYTTSIPFFADKGRAIPNDIAKYLVSEKDVRPFLQGDRDAGRQVVRELRKAKDYALAANAWFTHTTEKLVTHWFIPYWFINWAGGKWLTWLSGKIDLEDTYRFIRYASTKS